MPSEVCCAVSADEAEHATTRTSAASWAMPRARVIEAVEQLLAKLATPGAPMPHRDRVAGVLASALDALKPPSPAKEPSEDMLRALAAMVAEPRIVSTGDLGRALDPSLNTERACALGGNRMRQMLARRWVVRERFARWAVTEEGRAEHERLKPSIDHSAPGIAERETVR